VPNNRGARYAATVVAAAAFCVPTFMLAASASAATCQGQTTTAYPPASCGIELSASSVVQGSSLLAVGKGFPAGEQVSGVAHSTPVSLGTQTANAQGVVTFTVPTAQLAPGSHAVVLSGAAAPLTMSATFTVTQVSARQNQGNLAHTGTDVATMVGAGAALLVAGGATVVAVRRRRPSEA
jgi:hyaluronoglucosaminidase